MGEYAARFVDAGAALVGSCCGSTPAFTGAISDFAMGGRAPIAHGPARACACAGPRGMAATIGGGQRRSRSIGERINPTGKKALAESLRAGSLDPSCASTPSSSSTPARTCST